MVRQNFYNGQKVAPKNLNDLQSYTEKCNADLVSSLLGYGIVEGFEVEKISEMIVSVSGGLAYTEQGVRLFSETGNNITIDRSALPNSGDTILKLALRFDFNKTGAATDSTGSAVTTDWIPSVDLVLGNEITNTDLVIAEIKLSPVGILEIIENGQRFLNFEQQVAKTYAFSTKRTHESTTANISADILNLNTDININNRSLADTIRDLVYPTDCTYTQYPNGDTNIFIDQETPLVLFGGDWELRETKLFNNQPEIIINEFGTSYKYPNGRLEFFSYSLPHLTIVTYPITFTEDYPTSFSVIHNGNNGHIGQGSGSQQCGVTAHHNVNRRMCSVYTTIWKMKFSTYGYWKNIEDPITAEEERHYIKIWQRIA